MTIKYPYHIRLSKYLGDAVRHARRQKHMTQKDLADVTGTSVKFISQTERGKETVQMDKLFDLLRALSLHIYVTDNPMKTDRLYTGPHQVTLDQWISCAPFEKLLGIEIVVADDGHSYLTMPFLYQLAQGQGMAHGGAIVTLADTAVAMAIKSILPPDSRFGTISLNAEFLGPVTKGVLCARAEVTPLENRQVQGQAVVSDEDGRQVMRFSAMFKLGREVKITTHT